MHIFKKFLILVIVFISIFIIYRLSHAQKLEGFGEEEIENITKSNEPVTISNMQDKFMDLPLREFIVKSSYNSAISGEYANQEMIRILLQRGVRLLDFEIYTDNNIEYVSFSKDNDFTMNTSNEPADRLSFANAMSTVNAYSFIMPSPSPNDPLFVSLRIKNQLNNAEQKNVYKRIADIFKTSFPTRLYQDAAGKAIDVNSATPLRDIMGKVVIIFDTANKFSNYKNDCTDTANACSEIYPFVNIPANVTSGLPIYNYDDITSKIHKRVFPQGDGYGTDIDTFTMVAPPSDDVIQIPPPINVIKSFFPQFLLYKFYIKNSNLEEYENIFNQANSSFVPISVFLANLQTPVEDDDKKRVSAIPQKPAGPLGSSFKLW